MSESGHLRGAEGDEMALVLGVLEWMGWEVLTVAKERGIYIAARMVISVELLLCKLF